MKKKGIIFTVTIDLTFDQRMHKICTSLSDAGFEVKLVGRRRKSSVSLKPKAFFQHRLYVFFDKGKLFYLEYNIRLFFYLLFQRTDIFCAIDLDTILPNIFAGKIRNKKIAYDAHEYFTEVPEVIHRPKIQKIWKRVERFSVPKTDLCYTVSQSLAELFQEEYKKTFHLIRNCPTLAHLPASYKTEAPFILYQGALNKGRGLEELIKSMQMLPLKLKIAGEGDLSQELRELVQNLHLTDKVEFLGYVYPDDLKVLTPKAFLGYNLLENLGKSYYYSLSNKFFDYIHALVPSLNNDFPEYKYINLQYEVGLLAEPIAEDIAEKVNRLLNDNLLYKQLQENCLRAREVYNWQHEGKELIRMYEAL
jgi:glycosyltransferase involved in cell wall biosynthesis